MLRIYRRHRTRCGQTSERWRRCTCPIYVEGTLGGETIRKALDQTSWEAASDIVTAWTATGKIGLIRTDVPSVRESVNKFIKDAEARQLKRTTMKKLRNLFEKRLLSWCEQMGFLHLKQLDVDALRQFRGTWPDGPLTASKSLQALRSFLGFCQEAGWVEKNHARPLKPPKLPDKSTKVKVFTEEQVAQILAACEKYPLRNSWGYDNRSRIRAFILTLRYSGMRISDATGLKEVHVEGGKLSLNTTKTSTPIFVPLPQIAIEALEKIRTGNLYFFWTGNGERETGTNTWSRTLRGLFKIAGVKGNAHMFRHTFATDLLSRGVPIEDVSLLLGHKSVLITQAYYSHWVKDRRERLEKRVSALWQ